MLDAESFMDAQRAVLRRNFFNADEGKGSVEPYLSGGKNKVFYGVLLWHPYDISRKIEDASHGISELVPSIPCSAGDAHVGLAVYTGSESGDKVLKKLAEAVHRAKRDLRSPLLNYDGWFHNNVTVVAAGTGNDAMDDAFVSMVNGILKNYDGNDLERKRIAQITTNRFLERRTQEELEHAGFFGYMGSLPALGESRPTRLGVIHHIIDKTGQTIEPYEVFDL